MSWAKGCSCVMRYLATAVAFFAPAFFRLSFQTSNRPVTFTYHTSAAGKRKMGTSTAIATITGHSILHLLYLLIRGDFPLSSIQSSIVKRVLTSAEMPVAGREKHLICW